MLKSPRGRSSATAATAYSYSNKLQGPRTYDELLAAYQQAWQKFRPLRRPQDCGQRQ